MCRKSWIATCWIADTRLMRMPKNVLFSSPPPKNPAIAVNGYNLLRIYPREIMSVLDVHAFLKKPMVRNALTAWSVRAVSLLLHFIFIRQCITLLGAPAYTALALTLGLQTWAALADGGLGAALQQRLATFRDDAPRQIALMRYTMKWLVIAVLVLVPLFAILGYFVAEYYLHSIIGLSLIEKKMGFAFGLSGLVALSIGQTSQRILFGLGFGVRANLLMGVATAISICFGLLGGWLWSPETFIGLALGYSLGSAGLWWWIWFTFPALTINPTLDNQDREMLVGLARNFLCFALMGSLVLSMDYIILSYVCEQTQILRYNIANRIVLPGFLIVSTFYTAYQPEATYAFTRGKSADVLRKIVHVIMIGSVLIVGMLLAVGLSESTLLNWLAPNQKITLGYPLIGLLMLYYIVRIWTDGWAMIVLSSGSVKFILSSVFIQSVVAVPIQYLFAQRWGVEGLISGTILCFLLTVSWMIPQKALEIIRAT